MEATQITLLYLIPHHKLQLNEQYSGPYLYCQRTTKTICNIHIYVNIDTIYTRNALNMNIYIYVCIYIYIYICMMKAFQQCATAKFAWQYIMGSWQSSDVAPRAHSEKGADADSDRNQTCQCPTTLIGYKLKKVG